MGIPAHRRCDSDGCGRIAFSRRAALRKRCTAALNLTILPMHLFNNLKISGKLAVAFFTMVLLMVVLGLFAINRLDRLNQQTNFMVTARMASVRDAGQMGEIASQLRLLEYRLVTAGATGEAEVRQQMAQALQAYGALDKAYPASIGDPVEQSIYDRVKARYPLWLDAHERIGQLLQQDRRSEALELVRGDARAAFLALKEPLSELVRHNEERAAEEARESNETFTSGRLLIAGELVLATLLAVFLAWFVSRRIVGPLNEAVHLTQAIAAGDLTQSLETQGRDEVSDLLRALGAMRDNLVQTLSGMRDSSDSVATASAQIASGSADLSSRTEQAAGNLQETAASMEQLTGTVRSSADAARQANQLALAASQVAVRGGEVVTQVVGTMRDINASSQKISDIIGTIDSIAFQTNILALNAAVEAARAGEQGRGFAVVASEVRSLAQRSAVAAKEIKALIGASAEKVESGTRLVSDAGGTMGQIVDSVQRVADIIGEISAGAVDQSQGIGQVNAAVAQLDRMTQENSSLVEESAAAAESLRDQARQLSALVDFFQLSDTARPAAAPAQRPLHSLPAGRSPGRAAPGHGKPAAARGLPGQARTGGVPRLAVAHPGAGAGWEAL